VINDDEEYNKVLDKLRAEVRDGRLFIDVSSLVLVNESFAAFLIDNQEQLNDQSYWAMASVVEMWRSIYDTLTNRHAAELVPDDLEGLTEPPDD
jgi:hypothetical protein